MKFISTRGQTKPHTFEEALFSPGFLSDGGLLMPETIPQISTEQLQSWTELSLPELCKRILPLFINEDEISQKELEDIIDKAYSRLPIERVAALSSFPNGLNVLELGNTKTLAFKDLSTFIIGRMLESFLKRRREHVTLLVGTSGDTGPSAIEAVHGLDWIDIIVLFPKGYCTRIQELQMTTVLDDNVHIISADGSSDDLDLPIKAVCRDQEFIKLHNLCTLNSINMIRILIQIVPYVYGYLKVCRTIGEEVEIVVPTGAAGHLTGGCVAHHMGLPIKLVCATNSNDVIHRMVSSGEYSSASSVISTYSVAMDIQSPYNTERILFLFANGDTTLVKKLMEEYDKDWKTTIPESILKQMRAVLSSCSFDNNAITETMHRCWKDHSYLICPHTAVGVSYFFRKLDSMEQDRNHCPPTLCFSTANPAKFPEALIAAGLEPQTTPYIKNLTTMPQHCTRLEKGKDWEKFLREKITEIGRRSKSGE